LETLKRPVLDIIRMSKEIEELSREITLCENQLGDFGGALSASEIRTKMDLLSEQRIKLQRDQKSLFSEKEKGRLRIQGFKDKMSSIHLRITEFENSISTKKNLTRDLEDLKSQLSKVHDDTKVIPFESSLTIECDRTNRGSGS
jgi:chromosome segregation ATPase